MSDLYDRDILTWSERQSALLRRIAAGERVNSSDLDWPNIIEEIEGVGRSDLHAVESWLTQALLHDLKAQAWPQSRDAPHWRAEARLFRRQARRRFTESMRQKIDIAALYSDALAGLPETLDGQPPQAVSPVCPVTLDEPLGE
ncbi:MAG TPA: DUF29 family protein [Acetobacteraceae bacterium]|nr:DUF29 family protein [Acetobacteraceae bacterium]